ncbi:MAG: hypothetical protein KF702_07210 [Gammaproteobacteria bacterium]|nr:hypothetical protein [Gammaproteobacteria bacterium]
MYWINGKNPTDPEKYLSSANFIQGSWWNDWIEWFKNYSGKLQVQSAACLKANKLKIIEKAPGTYVKVRLIKEDINL